MNKIFNPAGMAVPNGFSHLAVSDGGTLVHIAGQVSYDAHGNIVGIGDLRAQTEQVYENIARLLDAAGATFDDVVKSTILIKDMTAEKVSVVRDVRRRYLSSTPPTSTLIAVPCLVKDELLVEIEAVAVIPERAKRND